jgi:hypothetical protein
MSTQSILIRERLSTNKAITEHFQSKSMDLLKRLRFDVGCIDTDKMRYMLRLNRLSCADWCTLDDDQRESVRQEVIKKSIKEIQEL